MRLYNYLRERLNKVDRAVFWGGMTRMSLFIATPLIMLTMASFFTPKLQGYYYTFGSLLALQVFGELGLGQVLLMFTSHEWSKLRFDEAGFVVGDPNALSRLLGLGRRVFRWFVVVGPVISVVLGFAGFFFFSQKADSEVAWLAPWTVLCILTGLNFITLPIWSLLNGCHQVAKVSFYRFIDSIFFNATLLITIISDLGLWVPVIATTVRLLWSVIFLYQRYFNFIRMFFYPQVDSVSWVTEIWPIQWRSAVCWISGYFAGFIFIPVIFHYHGAVLAGQTGMTLMLFEAIYSISAIWFSAKAPRLGTFIANRQYTELDQLFIHTTKTVALVSTVSSLLIWLLVYLLYYFEVPLALRFLSPLPTGIFFLGQILNILTGPMSLYLRAHKREPLMVPAIIQGGLSAVLVLVLGKYFSAIGIAVSCLLVNLVNLPSIAIIWYRCRLIWHSEDYVTKAQF